MSEGSRFLSRWSRLKKAAETASTAPQSNSPAGAEIPDAESLLANLTPESDFGVFMREEISEAVRRQAMKTLFADPHFNIMDGLDIYIEDYNLSEPIPPEMMATLNHAKTLFGTPDTDEPVCLGDAENCDILSTDGQNVAVEEMETPSPNDKSET